MRTLVVTVMLLLLSAPVLAKSPEGKSRVHKDVCNPLKSSTPGLYGLCVSYCKARELHSVFRRGKVNPAKAERVAARSARALDRYNERKTAADPDMPCVSDNAVCPCWSSSQLSASFWTDKTPEPYCSAMDAPTMRLDELATRADVAHPEYSNIRALSFSQDGVNFVNYCANEDVAQGIALFQEVNETDAIVCRTQIQATCGVLGL